MRRSERGGRLVYVLGSFPSLSETFILREILELEERGLRLSLLSLEPGDEVVHERAAELAERVVQRPRPLSLRSILGLVVAAIIHPFGFVGALLYMLGCIFRTPRATGELLRSFVAAAFFTCALRGTRPRHIHAHFATMPATVGLLLAQMLETTFSFAAHANDIFTGDAILIDRKIREAEFVPVCTQAGIEHLRLLHPVSSTGRLHLVYHGVDVAELTPAPHDLVGDPSLILSVGRLVEKKGFPVLLRAAALLRKQGVDFRLRIVGSGPDEADLKRLAVGLALEDYVQFVGPLPHEELIPLFREADLFVLASVVASDGDRDGLPNVLLEALALGVPAIGTRVSAIPELIEHEETGLLAKPGDPSDLAEQMERLLFDEQLRAKVIEQGRDEVVTRFDLKTNVGLLAELFAEVTGHRR